MDVFRLTTLSVKNMIDMKKIHAQLCSMDMYVKVQKGLPGYI